MQESTQKGIRRRWRRGRGGGKFITEAGARRSGQAGCMDIYMEVISLRAWSSSSLMALYFSF